MCYVAGSLSLSNAKIVQEVPAIYDGYVWGIINEDGGDSTVQQVYSSVNQSSLDLKGPLFVKNVHVTMTNSSLRAKGLYYDDGETQITINPVFEFWNLQQEKTSSITDSYLDLVSTAEEAAPIEGIPTQTDNCEVYGYLNDAGNAVWRDIVCPASFEISADAWLPHSFTVKEGTTFGAASQVNVKLEPGAMVQNKGILNNLAAFDCRAQSTQVTTTVSYEVNGGTPEPPATEFVCKNSDGVKTYGSLPSISKDEVAVTWCSDQALQHAVTANTAVLPNAHVLYARYGDAPDPGPGPDPDPTPALTEGWHQSDVGWQYAVDGKYVTGWCWIDDDFGAHWYYFNEDTYMACSQWQWDEGNGSWYWLCSSGPMIRGLWQWIDNEWYGFWWNGKMCRGWIWDSAWQAWFYCYNNGIMARSTWEGPYWLNWEGIWIR